MKTYTKRRYLIVKMHFTSYCLGLIFCSFVLTKCKKYYFDLQSIKVETADGGGRKISIAQCMLFTRLLRESRMGAHFHDEIDNVGTQLIEQLGHMEYGSYSVVYYLIPFLQQLKDTTARCCDLKMDEWHEILDEMIWAFTYKRDNFDSMLDKDRSSTGTYDNTSTLFGKYDENLWEYHDYRLE